MLLQVTPLKGFNNVNHLSVALRVKGAVSQDFFASGFFHESSSPMALKITLGSFKIFLKIYRYIRKLRCTTGINDTGSKFSTFTAGVVDTGGK
jgi:hypothetical protein